MFVGRCVYALVVGWSSMLVVIMSVVVFLQHSCQYGDSMLFIYLFIEVWLNVCDCEAGVHLVLKEKGDLVTGMDIVEVLEDLVVTSETRVELLLTTGLHSG